MLRLMLQGDCVEVMHRLADLGYVFDAIITDPPYGTTACKWDSVIPFDAMWGAVNRLIKPNGAVVFTATQPFTSVLINSNIKNFKYSWIWEKSVATNFLNAKKQPLRSHEDILIFYGKQPVYNPQMVPRAERKTARRVGTKTECYGKADKETFYDSSSRYPKSVLKIPSRTDGKLHPTQKPVALMEYLIKTYTNPDEVVLDFAAGSGTTGVAAINTGRQFIGIEREEKYFKIAEERLNNAITS